ncbi:hypothetical protein JXO59_13815 [candidate division KSB1 bacterium]|nr:hypothetical protein [candidate division KSB1 bacterium]
MNASVGLRREDKNIWERRVAITPQHAEILQGQHNIRICVQPFPGRAFSDQEYLQVGVQACEDLSPCRIIMGIKEIPQHLILSEKIYLFFSHTIKGQPYNMPMLQKIIDLKCTLIDYECIADERSRRLVFFGGFAGMAGMVETLRALGLRLKHQGFLTPLTRIKPAYEYHDLADIRSHLREIGTDLLAQGLPEAIRPLVFGFSGYGHVSRGAQEIFGLLPHTAIQPEDLESLSIRSDALLYKVQFEEKHMVEPIDSSILFDKMDYFRHPQKYRGIFENYLPYLHVLVNGIYWDERYPRLVTKEFLRDRSVSGQPLKLQLIGDVSCDINGSIECTEKVTTPDQPVFAYHPVTGAVSDGHTGDGILVMAIDNLPAELPRDASHFFSDSLWHLIPAVARAEWQKPFSEIELPAEIKKAVIVHNGRLTPDYTYLSQYLPKR